LGFASTILLPHIRLNVLDAMNCLWGAEPHHPVCAMILLMIWRPKRMWRLLNTFVSYSALEVP